MFMVFFVFDIQCAFNAENDILVFFFWLGWGCGLVEVPIKLSRV